MMFVIFVPIIYIISAFYNLHRIGIGWDSSVNLAKGEQVYRFLQSLDLTYFTSSTFTSLYFNELPGFLNGHPTAFSLISFTVGHFFSQMFGFHFYFFHISNVLMSFLFLCLVGIFVYILTKNILFSLLSQCLFISHPFFYLHSIVNVKDLPILVFSFFAIVLIYEKGIFKDVRKNYYLSLVFFVLATFSKFTVIFLVPVYLYLLVKLKIKFNKLRIFYSFLLVLFLTVFFYPHITFNFTDEIIRIFNVYVYLPVKSVNSASFGYFLFLNTPTLLLLIYFLTFIFIIVNKRYSTLFLIWTTPSIFYLVFINHQYDALRQFLFLLVPFSIFSFVFFECLEKYFSKRFINTLSIIFIVYLLFLFSIPLNEKIFYRNIFSNETVHDGWGLSVPLALDYINKNYTSGRIYYSPANFLLEYYKLPKFEIIYQPEYSDIWIASRKTSSYVEETQVREDGYILDEKFDISDGMIEIWVKK